MKFDVLTRAGAFALDKMGPAAAVISKKSPLIMTVAGAALLIGGNALSAWGAIKAKEELGQEMPEFDEEEEARTYAVKKAVKVASCFAPAVASTAAGTALIVVAYRTQESRLSAAIATCSAVTTAFSEYRANVISDQGEEADRKYRYGEHSAKADIYDEAEEGKKPKKHKEEVTVRDVDGGPWTAIFDDVSPDWTKNREQNVYFLKCQEVVANRKLASRGYLFLNEVLEMLGLPYKPGGQFYGWIDEAYEGSREGIVSFGLDYAYLEEELDLAQAEGRNPEPSLWLDFNVDGEIWDKVPLKRKQIR